MATRKNSDNGASSSATTKKQVKQTDLPRHSLRDALTVAQALTDNFAGDATPPHQISVALDISPTSSEWRTLTSAASAFGLINGSYKADTIGLTELGQRCTAPTEEGDDIKARSQAALKPSVYHQFFTKYNKSKFPPDHIAKNVLQHTYQIPQERTEDALKQLREDGEFVGFIHKTKGGPFVSIDDPQPTPVQIPTTEDHDESDAEENTKIDESYETLHGEDGQPDTSAHIEAPPLRVFISHGKNIEIVGQVKDVLDLYDIEYEVAVEEQSPAIPVPQKVLESMRRCNAGIMVVSREDENTSEHGVINNNVLIEVGAAFVLYDQRVVLLWEKKLPVPSNLQGLHRCEYEGNELTFSSGTKLAKAVKSFRN